VNPQAGAFFGQRGETAGEAAGWRGSISFRRRRCREAPRVNAEEFVIRGAELAAADPTLAMVAGASDDSRRHCDSDGEPPVNWAHLTIRSIRGYSTLVQLTVRWIPRYSTLVQGPSGLRSRSSAAERRRRRRASAKLRDALAGRCWRGCVAAPARGKGKEDA
jgi:hypothetical protein